MSEFQASLGHSQIVQSDDSCSLVNDSNIPSILGIGTDNIEKMAGYCCMEDFIGLMLTNKVIYNHLSSLDTIWKQSLYRDYGEFQNPRLADRKTSCATYRESYLSWRYEFLEYKDVLEVLKCWHVFETWASQNVPVICESLSKGASEEELQNAEIELGHSLPLSIRLLYKLHNGQKLLVDEIRDVQKGLGDDFPTVEESDIDKSMFSGMFGGYQFYDKDVNTRLLTLDQMVFYTKHCFSAEVSIMKTHPDLVIFAASLDLQKRFYVKCDTGDVYVSLRTIHDGVLPAAPLSFDAPRTQQGGRQREILSQPATASREGNFVKWFQEYCMRLETGIYKVEQVQNLHNFADPLTTTLSTISLFPQTSEHGATEQITNGVRVHVAPVFCPEMCSSREDDPTFFWVYSVTLELLEDHPSRSRSMTECQLTHRYWRIEENDGRVEEVRGRAVVGLYPHLQTLNPSGRPPFSYQSCTTLESIPGKMGGHFSFVPGTIGSPQGISFDATIKDFVLMEPEFIY